VASAGRPEFMTTNGTPPPGKLVSAKAAAAYIGMSYSSLRYFALKGLLPYVQPPGSTRMWFRREHLDTAIDRWTRGDGAQAPTIPNRARGRRPGVRPDRRETSGAAPATVPAIAPNGDGGNR
jgi:hypothetical protein